jgi:hypothetical protein
LAREATAAWEAERRVFGLYLDFASLRLGIDSLKALRFGNADISVLLPEVAVSRELGPEQGSQSARAGPESFIAGTLGRLTYLRPEGVGVISAALVALGVSGRVAERYEANVRAGLLLACVRLSSATCVESAAEALRLTGAQRVTATRVSFCAEEHDSGDRGEWRLAQDFADSVLVC